MTNQPKPETLAGDPISQIDELEALVWALLDEQLTPQELEQLERRLLQDEASRRRYAECMQLHAGLHAHFAPPATLELPPAPPVNPTAGMPPLLPGQGHEADPT